MNMWLHNAGTAEIANNNTLSAPQFTDEKTGALRTFDYVVANPPFSVKSWTTGVDVAADPFKRFVYGIPPDKNGDYAFLLHIIASLKSTGKGAVILPHGVLFRGNAEATIRRNLVKQGFIKAIIGLPANLFYGTGIPACIIVLDKQGAAARDHIFMLDASKGFVKDGPKNRLRERDIHRIVSTFLNQIEVEKYSRKVPVSEIADPKNDYNLNLPRYIDTSEPEDLEDLDAHLNGGIPDRDIDALDAYWKVFPNLRKELFESVGRPGYSKLTLPAAELSARFTQSAEYAALRAQAVQELQKWIGAVKPKLLAIDDKSRPKELVTQISEALLATFKASVLLDEYAIYQGLMELSAETLLDDAYLIIDNGWKDAAQLKALPIETDEKGKKKKRTGRVDYTINKVEHRSELLPPELLISSFFEKEARECADALSAAEAKLEELSSTYGGEDMLLSDVSNDNGEFTKKAVTDALKETKKTDEEYAPLKEVLDAIEAEGAAKKLAKDLDAKVIAKYGKLTEAEIQQLVVDDKWIGTVETVVEAELARVAGALVSRLQQLHRRYGRTAPALETSVSKLSDRVHEHLKSMGLSW
jgi:type I restriction enzyme M protein